MTVVRLDDWQTESLRLSAFVTNAITPASVNLWEQLMGEAPEEVQHKPRQQAVKEEGQCLNGLLSVEANRNRIDWRLNYDPKSPHSELPVIGSYESLQNEFQRLMQKWITQCPPIHRLAYGAVLLCSMERISDAFSFLDRLLPDIQIDWKNAHDFLYRINRRRGSECGIKKLEINRVSTWSVMSIPTIVVDLSPTEQRTTRVTQSTGDSLCRLELDINTAPEFRHEIEKREVSRVFAELVALGNEIASSGDIP